VALETVLLLTMLQHLASAEEIWPTRCYTRRGLSAQDTGQLGLHKVGRDFESRNIESGALGLSNAYRQCGSCMCRAPRCQPHATAAGRDSYYVSSWGYCGANASMDCRGWRAPWTSPYLMLAGHHPTACKRIAARASLSHSCGVGRPPDEVATGSGELSILGRLLLQAAAENWKRWY